MGLERYGMQPESGKPMRIVFYNIRYGTGCDWNYHLPVPFSGFFRSSKAGTGRISDYLDSLDADVVCLCEVDGGSYRHGSHCQAERMASKSGRDHVFVNKYGRDSMVRRLPILSNQGNAVLSSLPIVASRERFFSRGIKKACLEVEFDGFYVLLAHLSLGKKARTVQLRELAGHCRMLEKPVILGGDFNLLSGPEELQPLFENTGMRDADTLKRPTFPSQRPGMRLDYVLASEEIEIHRLEVPRVKFSDHLPIVCDLEIK